MGGKISAAAGRNSSSRACAMAARVWRTTSVCASPFAPPRPRLRAVAVALRFRPEADASASPRRARLRGSDVAVAACATRTPCLAAPAPRMIDVGAPTACSVAPVATPRACAAPPAPPATALTAAAAVDATETTGAGKARARRRTNRAQDAVERCGPGRGPLPEPERTAPLSAVAPWKSGHGAPLPRRSQRIQALYLQWTRTNYALVNLLLRCRGSIFNTGFKPKAI